MENDKHSGRNDEARELRQDIEDATREFEAGGGYSHEEAKTLIKQQLVREHKGKLHWSGDLDAMRTDD
ncbi:MAG: hypothetical protein RhofKO_24030 [Rhodothermales bacterium]